jgi:hypothetical protein
MPQLRAVRSVQAGATTWVRSFPLGRAKYPSTIISSRLRQLPSVRSDPVDRGNHLQYDQIQWIEENICSTDHIVEATTCSVITCSRSKQLPAIRSVPMGETTCSTFSSSGSRQQPAERSVPVSATTCSTFSSSSSWLLPAIRYVPLGRGNYLQ